MTETILSLRDLCIFACLRRQVRHSEKDFHYNSRSPKYFIGIYFAKIAVFGAFFACLGLKLQNIIKNVRELRE